MELTQEQKDFLEKVRTTAETATETRATKLIQDALGGLKIEDLKNLDADKLKDLDIDGLRSAMEMLANKPWEAAQRAQSMSIRAQMEQWGEDNKENLKAIKEGNQRDLAPMQLRAPITMTLGASLGSSAYLPDPQIAPGIVDLVRVQPTFWRLLNKKRVKANPYIWIEKFNKQGTAQFLSEGELKPLASFELRSQTSNPKKVAERMKFSTEILYDYDAMETIAMEELRYEVETAANLASLFDTADSEKINGVTIVAAPYSLTTIKTDNPTYSDAIRAAIGQIRNANFGGMITAYINPIDGANMDLAKASDSGVYLLPPFASVDGRTISGVRIIEDNNIPVGKLLIGDMSKYNIAIHQDFFIKWGWENDDFSKNLVTMIGEMRIHQWFSANNAGSIIYDDFADIITLLTA